MSSLRRTDPLDDDFPVQGRPINYLGKVATFPLKIYWRLKKYSCMPFRKSW